MGAGVVSVPGTAVPDFIDDWFAGLAPVSLAEAVGEPGAAAVFSTDMINGFCREGALASERVGALAGPVSDLFRRAYDLGVRRFVLTQDTHDPAAPEFEAWPPHCVRGTVEAETIAELGELPFASELVVFEKNSLHPALGTGFDAWLDDQPGLRTGVVVGNCTDLCVYQLAMHLRLRHNAGNVAGVRVIVPANAVDTYDLAPGAAAGAAMAHPGEFFHRVFLYHLALNGVEVVAALR